LTSNNKSSIIITEVTKTGNKILEVIIMEYLGRFWNDKNIEIYEIEGRKIALAGWNGETYEDCFEVKENMIDTVRGIIRVKPIYKEIAEDEFEIVDYEII
jgi:hypothetical protein